MAHLHVKTLTQVGRSDSHQILIYTNTTYIHTSKKKNCSKYLYVAQATGKMCQNFCLERRAITLEPVTKFASTQ